MKAQKTVTMRKWNYITISKILIPLVMTGYTMWTFPEITLFSGINFTLWLLVFIASASEDLYEEYEVVVA